MCDNMKILAESGENHFIAYCSEHDEFQLAWKRITLHLPPEDFIQLQTMFEEILMDEMLLLMQNDGDDWVPQSEEEAFFAHQGEEMDDDDEDMLGDDDEGEFVLWFEEVALRVTIDEFQELAFLVNEAALAADIRPENSVFMTDPQNLPFMLPPTGTSLFSLN